MVKASFLNNENEPNTESPHLSPWPYICAHLPFQQITWPYGGREVFLSFSFSGYTDLLPMTLVDSSGIFFRLCDLPLGCHQYKFWVDGVWRFNDQQGYGQDEYGIFNYIQVVDPQEEASSSGDSDVDISRRRLCMHLANHTVYDLMPNSAEVFALDAEVTVKVAFHEMHKKGLAVVPIWDSNRRHISAMLTASDFILMLMELHRNFAMVTDEQLEVHTISAWKEVKTQLNGEAVGPAHMMFGRPLIRAGPDESLSDVAMRILHYKISTIPVIHSTKEESCPLLLHIACLGGILKYMCRHFRNNLDYLPLLRRPVGSLSLGKWTSEVGGAHDHLLVLRPNDTLRSALNILRQAKISSIPIVDGDGSLINIYSRSDITSLAKDDAYTHIQLDQTVISQVPFSMGARILGKFDLGVRERVLWWICHPHRRFLQVLELADGPNRYHTCTRSDPLYVVMERLSDPVVRRLIVIDAGSLRVEGIITLSDVFRFILNYI